MSAPSAALLKHMRENKPLALLAEIDHPDGTVYVWSRTGTLTYGGHDWRGLGILGKVRPIGTKTDITIRQTSFELRGVPAQATAFLASNVRGRSAKLWLAGTKPGPKVIGTWLLQQCVLDYQTLSVADDGSATIALIGYAGFWTLDRAQNLAWTSEEQQRTYPDDTGLDLIPDLVSKDVRWAPA